MFYRNSVMRQLAVIFTFALAAGFHSADVFAQDGSAVPAATTAAARSVVLESNDDRYRIGFQDVLQITVFKHGELNQPRVAVNPTGQILLFRLDEPIVAVCKTEQELAQDIAAAYKKKFVKDPEVQVVVVEQKSQSIGVIGAVERPGNFFLSRRVHLLELLALAGGPNKEAGTRLIVARTGSSSNCHETTDTPDDAISVTEFKIRDIQEGKQTFWMKPGDVVSLQAADVVYVYGNVNEQGEIKVREPITLTQAIVSAKGLKPSAKKDKIRILRHKPGSIERDEFVFDLNAIDKRKINDPYLEPGDIVAVSQDATKAILHGITDTLKSSVPAVAYRF